MPSASPTSDGAVDAQSGAGEPLRHGAFRWLISGRSASYLGNAVAPIALAFAVLDLTGSVTDLGWVVGARSVANVALLLFGGVVADRLPRAVVLTASCAAAALTQGMVAALVLTGAATVPLLVVLGAVNGAVSAMAFPAAAALTPQTVPERLVRQANALLRLSTNTALVGGTAVGGVLVAGVGPGWGIAVDAAMFAASGIFFSRIRVPDVRHAGTDEPSTWRQLREGWGEFTRRTWVWVVVLQFMVVNAALTGGIAVLGPAVADDTFGRRTWGFVLAVQTLGMVVGGLIALRWQPRHALRYGVALTALTAAPLLVLAHAPRPLVLAAVLLLDGIAIEQFGVAWDVSLQQNVPADRLARVYSYDAVGSFVAIPVGEMLVGPVAGQVGLEDTLTGAAVLVVLATVAALASGSVRSLRRTDGGTAEDVVTGRHAPGQQRPDEPGHQPAEP
ncbi:MAG TPA: MFS transporter [Actinomycetales bacterium]|nr:MFS transporter [Actinomycetales bacterium]